MTDAKTLAAGFVQDLRSPLARVELAVSQLARDANTPTARELVATISAAVHQADRDIDRILALLAPMVTRRRGRDDLAVVMKRLRNRIRPVLEARGTACEEFVAEGESPRGDPALVERAALALVRAGCELVGVGGRIALGLARHGTRFGVVLECRAAPGNGFHADPDHAFVALLPLAASHHGTLESGSENGAGSDWRATLWFPEESTCRAS